MKLIHTFVISVNENISRNVEENTQRFKCSKCTEIFYTPSDRKEHFEKIHLRRRRGRSHSVNRKTTVPLKRLQFIELQVSTTRVGFREVSYIGTSTKQNHLVYEHYRVCTVPAINRSHKPRQKVKASSVPLSKSVSILIPEIYPSIFSLYGQQNDVHSILSILTGDAMSVSILDAFLSHMLHHYNKANEQKYYNTRYKKFVSTVKYRLLPVLFLPFESGIDPFQTYQCNKKYYPITYQIDEDTIIFSPFYCANHFYLAVLNFRSQTCTIYDSSWTYLPTELRAMQCQRLIEELVGLKVGDKWQVYSYTNACQQIDGTSCGIYVMYYMENFLNKTMYKNRIQLSANEIQRRREDIVVVLLESTGIGKRFLEAISI